MKILLTSLNTKYIHNNIAIRYLKDSVFPKYNCDTFEFTINQNIDEIIYQIISKDYDLIGFSTYIWNVEKHLEICKKLKQINPNLILFLGGPEVSFNSFNILEENDCVDYIMTGEGEESFPKFLEYIHGHLNMLPSGVVGRKNNEIVGDGIYQYVNLNNSVLNYTKEYIENKKIVYYETSRGCPYNCEFCLSSATGKVRFYNMERCLKDIKLFLDEKVPLVKFIDRTFNFNKDRSIEILNYIIENDNNFTTFHLEIHPHLIDDDYLKLFKQARKDLFQFEVGVQSTNLKTCKAINRVGDFDTIKKVCKEIMSFKNIHLHLDLIAGLPYEDLKSLRKSFNDILSIKPDKLQLGFLKVLKGSPIYFKAKDYGIIYDEKSPFEVIYTNWISYLELQEVKKIEEMVEKYYNEGYFNETLNYLFKTHYLDYYEFFKDLSKYWDKNELFFKNHSRDSIYKFLKNFILTKNYSDKDLILELLIHDYIVNNHKFPSFIEVKTIKQSDKHDFLRDEKILKQISEDGVPAKKLVKNYSFVYYDYNIISEDKKEEKILLIYRNKDGKYYNITN